MSQNDEGILLNYIRYLEGDDETAKEKIFANPDNWFAIDQLEYSIENTKIDIFDSSLKGYKILFCPDSEIKIGNVYYEDKIIFIAGDIASFGGLSIVLHELSDGRRDQKNQRTGK